MQKIFLYAPQVLLTIFFLAIASFANRSCAGLSSVNGDDVLDISNSGCDGINLRISKSTFPRDKAEVTAGALWRTNINKPGSTLAFSGRKISGRETMPKILLYAPQVLLTAFFQAFRQSRIDLWQAFQTSTAVTCCISAFVNATVSTFELETRRSPGSRPN